jgi:hypothetical protein
MINIYVEPRTLCRICKKILYVDYNGINEIGPVHEEICQVCALSTSIQKINLSDYTLINIA